MEEGGNLHIKRLPAFSVPNSVISYSFFRNKERSVSRLRLVERQCHAITSTVNIARFRLGSNLLFTAS